MGRKSKPTKKLAVQLIATAKLVAKPLAPTVNNSETMNHGIDPGPVANMMTNKNTTMTPMNLKASMELE